MARNYIHFIKMLDCLHYIMQYKSNFTIWYRNCSISEVDENLNEQLGNKFCDQRRKNTIKMICEDNANQTAKAVTAYLKLVNIDKVQAIVTARMPVANALTPLASSAKVFTVFTFADLPQGDKTYILNYHFPVSDECKVLAEFAKKKLGLKGAILVANDDLGRLGANFFKQYQAVLIPT